MRTWVNRFELNIEGDSARATVVVHREPVQLERSAYPGDVPNDVREAILRWLNPEPYLVVDARDGQVHSWHRTRASAQQAVDDNIASDLVVVGL